MVGYDRYHTSTQQKKMPSKLFSEVSGGQKVSCNLITSWSIRLSILQSWHCRRQRKGDWNENSEIERFLTPLYIFLILHKLFILSGPKFPDLWNKGFRPNYISPRLSSKATQRCGGHWDAPGSLLEWMTHFPSCWSNVNSKLLHALAEEGWLIRDHTPSREAGTVLSGWERQHWHVTAWSPYPDSGLLRGVVPELPMG